MSKLFFLIVALFLLACTPTIENSNTISQETIAKNITLSENFLLIDVRTDWEFRRDRIPSAVNIPIQILESQISRIKTKHFSKIVLYCETGVRSNYARKLLENSGIPFVYRLEGDMLAWRKAGLPIEKGVTLGYLTTKR